MKYLENKYIDFYLDEEKTSIALAPGEFRVGGDEYNCPIAEIKKVCLESDSEGRIYLEITGRNRKDNTVFMNFFIENAGEAADAEDVDKDDEELYESDWDDDDEEDLE